MDIHKVIGKLPKPRKGFTLTKHKYTGPYNPLDKQLDENDLPLLTQEPYNSVDAISMDHDICYRDNDTKKGKTICDKEMLKDLKELEPENIRARIDKKLVQAIIGSKRKIGLGVKKSGSDVIKRVRIDKKLIQSNIRSKRKSNLKKNDNNVIKWNNQLANELHKNVRKFFKKRRVFSHDVDAIWTADLVDMSSFAKKNNGYKYILMVLDIFSKYGWAYPLKTKKGLEVTEKFTKLFNIQKPPRKLWTDKGTEFYNKHLKTLLKKNNVKLYSTENEEKSSVIERWNRTIKSIMWKYFTANNTFKYINVLEKIIEKYNKTYNRSIKCTPTFARKPSSFQHVSEALYGNIEPSLKKPKYKIGDNVRITKKKKHFEKAFTPGWSEELFKITRVKPTNPITYEIVDTLNGEVKGSFYEPELQKTHQEIFRIEKVLKKRTGKNGIEEIKVKWSGYPTEFNTWIPLKEVEQIL